MLKHLIHRKTLISMIFLGLSLLGLISYSRLPLELLPNTELPFLIVQVQSLSNADPQFIEREAIIPLEGVVSSLDGIDKLESYCDRRRAGITVYFENDVNMKYAYLRLQEKVDQTKGSLGDEFLVYVLKVDTEQLTNMFMTLQIRGSGGTDRIRYLAENEIIEPLNAVDGVVNVELFGGREKTIEIILNSSLAESYGITPGSLRSLLSGNRQFKEFAGHIEENRLRYFVNVKSEYTEITSLENIVLKPEIPLLLKDIAEVRFGVKEETSISRVNGKEAVTAQIVRDNQANIIALSEDVTKLISSLNEKLEPQDIKIVTAFDASEILKTNIDLIKELALIGGLLAIMILWFFLRHIRLVSVIALAIPISVLTSFFLFYLFDITLNSLTLVGIALAVGMLLDNSIVVLENIYRLVQKRRNAEEAVLQGTGEVWRSIFAATLTTITVFLPFVFAENFFVKILGWQIGVSIISTLLVSLLAALLLVPMITHHFLQKKSLTGGYSAFTQNSRFNKIYFVFLKLCMRHPFTTVILTTIIFFFSLFGTLALSINVPQEAEVKEFNLYVTMPSGSTLDLTDETVGKLEDILKDVPELEDVISQIYDEEAVLSLRLKEEFEELDGASLQEVKEKIHDQTRTVKTAEISFEQPVSSGRFSGGRGGGVGRGTGPGGGMAGFLGIGSNIESILIKGQDTDLMLKLAEDINYQLEELSAVTWSRVSTSDERPEIHLQPDHVLLDHSNVTLARIASELSSFEKETSAGLKYKTDNEEYDIIIRNDSFEEKNMDDLKKLGIKNEQDAEYQLQDISRIMYAFGPSRISRINQERQVEIRYRFQQEITESSSYLDAARAEVDQVVEGFELPAGTAVEVIHEENDLSDFYLLIAAAIVLIYMILASVFESLLTPFVIMLTIPLAGIGSLWAVMITNNSLLNSNSLIGFLILLGIVVNNGIILLDYTRILRRRGFRRSRALMTAGISRIRPIFITAISTIAAMIPLAMGRAEYTTQIAAPFAVTVIGGLSFSTVFTLIFIPTFYTALENALDWFKSLAWQYKALQGIVFILGIILIYFKVDGVIWPAINFIILLLVIPSTTYFILASLKRARADLIPPGRPITISITNLYKVYGLPGRFRRDWRKINGRAEGYSADSNRKFQDALWITAVLGFLVYFVYFFLEPIFWVFVLMHAVYFFALFALGRFKSMLQISLNKNGIRAFNILHNVIIWALPLFNIILFVMKWEGWTTAVFSAIIWSIGLAVFFSSKKLRSGRINILQIKGRFVRLRKWYYLLIDKITSRIGSEPFPAVKGVSVTIENGMFGLLGPNGAGKTTLMRMICGILDQNYGRIKINNFDTSEYREELQGIIGYLPQEFGTYENLSAREFLDYQAVLKGITDPDERKERIDYVLNAVHLSGKGNAKIGSFSGGMKQRVGIAQTLLHLPRILVVDEPTAGLDPRERIRFRNLLVDLCRERIVIFSTHIIEDISSSCDNVTVLDKGRVKYLGNPQEMTRLADGKVWQFLINEQDFSEYQNKVDITHHIRIKDKLRIRCLSEQKPHPEAKMVKPNLEDSYLWLAGSGVKANGNLVN